MIDFSKARDIFRDIVDPKYYIPIPSIERTKEDLVRAITQREKMVFLMSEAGTGKSMMLNRIYEELIDDIKIFFYSNPFMEIESLLNVLENLRKDDFYVFLLDEAQLLPQDIFENLRIYADMGHVSFVFSTHETDLNKLLRKQHFRTRINYILNIPKPNQDEIEHFIRTKLIRHELDDIANMFRKRNFKLIYKYSNSSLRGVNQLMFKMFDILDYFYKKNPSKVNLYKLQNKYIEMAYMDIGDINA